VKVFAELYRKTRELELLNLELERRVDARTAELALANAQLEQRVEERTREREAALAQVHEMQKMESLGQLTGGVAHDFNNLLMAVLGNLELLKKRMPDAPLLKRLVDGAIAGAERGATLTKRMLAFARRQELKPAAVQLSALIEGMEDMLRRSLGPTIDIKADVSEHLPPVRIDPHQFELALLNLALNARDAMPQGGQLTIEAGRDEAAGANAGLTDGEFIRVVVTDSGSGMDEATLKRATEPFFTTKGVGKGTGLGLPMVHGLVVQSGGAMQIASQIGQGTSVQLWLPVDRLDAVPKSTMLEDRVQAVLSCRVMVVDDDPLILSSTAAMLEDLGHIVIEASSATSALEILRADAKVDVIVTDHAMPGMTGIQLTGIVRQQWPWMPVILASGYADLPEAEDAPPQRLAKPFNQSELARCIGMALEEQKIVPIDAGRRA
jgi:signal transduction histidine kinase/ActR/RegA family two-component response regulator